jgi:hypothetical protein
MLAAFFMLSVAAAFRSSAMETGSPLSLARVIVEPPKAILTTPSAVSFPRTMIAQDRVVARHRRCWEKERVIFDPLHYLALLERKPGALDHARPLEGWDLPPCFALLRRRLEAQDEKGTREYIKVLRLLESIPLAVLTGAVEHGLSIGAIQSEAIRLIALHRQEAPVALFSLDGHPHLKGVHVGPLVLAAYRDLVPPPAEG